MRKQPEEWTRYQDNRLRQLYQVISLPEIAKLIDRTLPSIRRRIHKMGLNQTETATPNPPGDVNASSKITEKQLSMVCDLLEEEWTIQEIYSEMFLYSPDISIHSLRDRVKKVRGTQLAGVAA